MARHECLLCGAAQTGDRFLCDADTRRVADAIWRAGIGTRSNPSLLAELLVTAGRLSRIGESVGHGKASSVGPRLDVLPRWAGLTAALTAWQAALGLAGPPRADRGSTGHVAALRLWGHPHLVIGSPDVGSHFERLAVAMTAASAAIDAPPRAWYAGQCSAQLDDGTLCPEDIYALSSSGQVRCRRCRAVHSIEARRQALVAAVSDVLATATEIRRAVRQLDGRPITPEWLRQVRHRGRLVQRGIARATGEPLYRVGDVLDLL